MELVKALQEIFEARYVRHEPQETAPSFEQRIHGNLALWFCPGCGVQLDEHGECPRCHYHLRDVSYHLIERCPHIPVPRDAP